MPSAPVARCLSSDQSINPSARPGLQAVLVLMPFTLALNLHRKFCSLMAAKIPDVSLLTLLEGKDRHAGPKSQKVVSARH